MWQVLPLPAAVVVAALAVAGAPSPEAVVALVLLATTGSAMEIVIWRALRARWARGEVTPEHSLLWLAPAAAVFAGAGTVKLHDAEEGTSWAEAARSSLAITAVLIVLGTGYWLYDRSKALRD